MDQTRTEYVEPFDVPIGTKVCDETTCDTRATYRDSEGYAWCDSHRGSGAA